MAGKPRNRLELRRQHDAAEPVDPMEDEADDAAEADDDGEEVVKKPKKKAKAPAKPKVKVVKVPKPAARMRIVWTVVNDAFKTVGTFEYAQKEAAEARAAELTAKGKGTHFVQKVKEAMPDNAPGIGAAIPRPILAAVVTPTATLGGTDEAEPEAEAEADTDAETDEEDEDEEPEEEEDDEE